MSESVTLDNLPITAHSDWARRGAANDATYISDAQALAPHYEKSGSSRPIFVSARDQLFQLQGAETTAHFSPPPITTRPSHHVFVNGVILTQLKTLADDEALEWERERPTQASLKRRFDLPETEDNSFVKYLEVMLSLQRDLEHIYTNMHKKKA